jgi:tetratricopeptide (TPR) repeat protein
MASLKTIRALALSVLLLLTGLAEAGTPEEMIRPLWERWAEIKYVLPEKERAAQYHALALRARALAESNPYLAEPLVWEGIAFVGEAEAAGGLEAYVLAKKAKDSLEESLKLHEKALRGSAYTGLAVLHARELVWPFGFGGKNRIRAEKYFKKALAIDPAGIDANFLYGEYLFSQYRLGEARVHLERALKAPPRPDDEIAAGGRRAEIQALLEKIEKDLKIVASPAGRR